MGRSIVTHSHKRDLKSLGLMWATGKEVRDNHYIHHWTALLQVTRTFLSFKIQAWFRYQIKLHLGYFLTVPISHKWQNRLKTPFVRTGHICSVDLIYFQCKCLVLTRGEAETSVHHWRRIILTSVNVFSSEAGLARGKVASHWNKETGKAGIVRYHSHQNILSFTLFPVDEEIKGPRFQTFQFRSIVF